MPGAMGWFASASRDHSMVAACTFPTLCVFVIMTGPSRKPDSSTQVVPVISPFPFSEYQPAKTGSYPPVRGITAVTPVRTGPSPTTSSPSPSMIVVCPTRTPATSVIAFRLPGSPGKGIPRSRALGASWATSGLPARLAATSRSDEKRMGISA